MNEPSIQFFPGDWLRDAISGCSLPAQGLWLRLLILMHDSPRRGYLMLGNSPMPDDHAARKVGTDVGTYRALLAELEAAHVPSRAQDGTLYSRRMVRDEQTRTAWRDKKQRQRGKPPVSGCPPNCPPIVPSNVPALSRPSSSSSSISSSENTKDPPTPHGGHEAFQAALADWLGYKRERRSGYKPRGLKALYAQLEAWGPDRSIAAIKFSMRQGWSGLFEPDTNGVKPREPFVFKPPPSAAELAAARRKKQAEQEYN